MLPLSKLTNYFSRQLIGKLNSCASEIQHEARCPPHSTLVPAGDQGAPIFLQVWHCGRASHNLYQPNQRAPFGPSPVAIERGQCMTMEGPKVLHRWACLRMRRLGAGRGQRAACSPRTIVVDGRLLQLVAGEAVRRK